MSSIQIIKCKVRICHLICVVLAVLHTEHFFIFKQIMENVQPDKVSDVLQRKLKTKLTDALNENWSRCTQTSDLYNECQQLRNSSEVISNGTVIENLDELTHQYLAHIWKTSTNMGNVDSSSYNEVLDSCKRTDDVTLETVAADGEYFTVNKNVTHIIGLPHSNKTFVIDAAMFLCYKKETEEASTQQINNAMDYYFGTSANPFGLGFLILEPYHHTEVKFCVLHQ